MLSADPETGRQSYERVERAYVRQVDETLLVKGEDGRTIETTAEHPFWVARKGFVEAKRLARSDLLQDSRGRSVAVREVQRRPGQATVHNLTVACTHTCFAGGVWVRL